VLVSNGPVDRYVVALLIADCITASVAAAAAATDAVLYISGVSAWVNASRVHREAIR